ncbi:hypothetical protein WN48_10894 [Eufriesea mexicana]|uniref:CCHC-type domain-containing protein n=1 Tax=Eufriesea mexicana TaxID=516756 RepID=A0A310SFM5_9HYME|nr:hypothetical protein WN48_10894 [Eufriesea mexicana]
MSTGLDNSVTPCEETLTLSRAGRYDEGKVRTGEIRRSPSELDSMWIQYPLAAARKVEECGRIRVLGYQVMVARKLQCYQCHSWGHARQWCTSDVYRSAVIGTCKYPFRGVLVRVCECEDAWECRSTSARNFRGVFVAGAH